MKIKYLQLGISICILLFIYAFSTIDIVPFEKPKDWPDPVYNFDKNPLSEAGIELGRHLFYDPILSRDSTISCSSCHLQYTAFTHVDHDLSHGIEGRIGTRNSPALTNLAWSTYFMWDGAINHLDMQALAPVEHKTEMDNDIKTLIETLQDSPKYQALFKAAYPDGKITGERFLKALSQFQLTLVSSNSKYDKVMRKEEGFVFSEQEEKGYTIFKRHCASCHSEPLFSNYEFKNNGLAVDTTLNDYGRMLISKNPKDSLLFKVPSLRNIEFSYPYMHDGRFNKLHQVVKHYTNGIQDSPTLAKELKEKIALSSEERTDLVAFLLTLTDKEFLFNPAYSFPRE